MASVLMNVADHVAIIVLNRPEAMNSVDAQMRAELHRTWERVHADPAIRVAIVTGAGDKAFCAGGDLKEAPSDQAFDFADNREIHAGPEHCDKPVIAAVNGFAIGGGMALALACDIRICSENARFAMTQVRIGSIPSSGGTQRLPRFIGRSDAMMMLLTGNQVDAREALRIGLVSRVVPAAELMAEAGAIAKRIAQNAPLSVRAIKRLVTQGMEMPLAAALDAERHAFGLLYESEDRREGRRAFVEKRKPEFKGR